MNQTILKYSNNRLNYVNNWASCDTLCNHTIGDFVMMYPEFIVRLKCSYSKYSIQQVAEMTKKAGLKIVRIIEIQPEVSFCIIAENKNELN